MQFGREGGAPESATNGALILCRFCGDNYKQKKRMQIQKHFAIYNPCNEEEN